MARQSVINILPENMIVMEIANKFGTIRDKKGVGEYFGEDLLDDEVKTNRSTILTNKTCLLLAFSKELFAEIKHKFSRKRRAHIQFI